ncbi:MAG: VOC family protein [Acidobacteria bacterium]|nr:VOC family protein [Acidobacteriota bacterium]
MSIEGSRIYHVNVNCSDLERSARFYEALGLRRVLRTVPSATQSGEAFGLDEVAWDAWMMQSDDAMDGLSLDLLQWITPPPTGAPSRLDGEPGFNRLMITTPDLDAAIERALAAGGTLVGGPVEVEAGPERPVLAMVLDPDGVPVQLLAADGVSLAQVVINCVDIDATLTYYTEVMGLVAQHEVVEMVWTRELFGTATDIRVRAAILADRGSRVTVALVQWLDPAPVEGARVRSANELGLFRMAWSTPDCAADEATIRAAGSRPLAPTGELSVGDEFPLLEVLFWPGPNGECLELIETTDRFGPLVR